MEEVMTKKQCAAKIAWERRYESKLLPCAHCGQKAIIVQWCDTKTPNATWVACQNPRCMIMTDSQHHKDRDTAAMMACKIWNKRVPMPAIVYVRGREL